MKRLRNTPHCGNYCWQSDKGRVWHYHGTKSSQRARRKKHAVSGLRKNTVLERGELNEKSRVRVASGKASWL